MAKKKKKKAAKKAAKKVTSKKKKVTKKAPAKKAAKKAKKKVAKKAAKKVTKKVAKKTPAKKSKKKATKKVAKKATKKVAKKATKKVAKKATPTKKAAKKVTKKGETKKVEPKKVAKKVTKKAATEKKTKKESTPPVKIQIQKDVVLTDAEGRILCRVRDCDQPAVVEGYCRYHYLLFWKRIQARKRILSEGKLEKYIEELTSRYPNKYLEMLKKDLSTENDFMNAIMELEIDDTSGDDSNEDFEEERTFIEEVRGMSERENDREESEY